MANILDKFSTLGQKAEMTDTFKIAIAQVSTLPGRLETNTQRILEHINRARELGAKLVIFPELCLPGYLVMDLCFNEKFLEEQGKCFEQICNEANGISVILGYIRDSHERRPGGRPKLYNSAAFIKDRQFVAYQDKILLPDYDIFDEHRYFVSGVAHSLFEIEGVRIGVGICEDLWSQGYEKDPLAELRRQGADLLVNISASPFETGKFQTRYSLLQDTVKRLGLPLIYVNLFGAYDGFDGEVVFDGRGMAVSSDGRLQCVGRAFAEDLLVFDAFDGSLVEPPAYDEVDEIHSALITGLQFYFSRHGFKKAVIGLSGGIDSSVVAALAVEALGAANVIGLSMPSRFSTDGTKSDALTLVQNLGIQCKVIPIEEPFRAMLKLLRSDPAFAELPEDVTEENIQPRLRMTILYAESNKFGGVVLNTGNKTELALGYCTIYGDLAGGLGVIADLNKDRVYRLADFINKKSRREIIPVSVIQRPPSAELKQGQSDAAGMGAEPRTLSPLVDAIVDGMTFTEAKKRFSIDFSPELIERTWRSIHQNEWKRRQASPGIRVTSKAFGHGRRVPMGHEFLG